MSPSLLVPLPSALDLSSSLREDRASELEAGLVWAADALGLPAPAG